MSEEDVERNRRIVIDIFGPSFTCYGNPAESCLHGVRWMYRQEPCKSCITHYGKHLEKLMRPRP